MKCPERTVLKSPSLTDMQYALHYRKPNFFKKYIIY